MQRTFYDTTELVKPFARRLHAALTEIRGNKVRVSPTVAWELGKRGAINAPETPISVAEAELQQEEPRLSEGQRSRLQREAWWAQQWRDRESVHEKVELSDAQMEIRDSLLGAITRHGFPKLGEIDVSENRDSVIICEVIALEGELLLTHNINSIDHAVVNEWAIETGPRFGPAPPSSEPASNGGPTKPGDWCPIFAKRVHHPQPDPANTGRGVWQRGRDEAAPQRARGTQPDPIPDVGGNRGACYAPHRETWAPSAAPRTRTAPERQDARGRRTPDSTGRAGASRAQEYAHGDHDSRHRQADVQGLLRNTRQRAL